MERHVEKDSGALVCSPGSVTNKLRDLLTASEKWFLRCLQALIYISFLRYFGGDLSDIRCSGTFAK